VPPVESTISKSLAYQKFCYIHQQILDDLAAEDKALFDARKEILWKEYLIKKLKDKMGRQHGIRSDIKTERTTSRIDPK
jgi:hypothetical protein